MSSASPTPRRATSWLRRPWVWVVFGVGLLALMGAALRWAPYFGVNDVSVKGNAQVTTEQVMSTAGVDDGAPLLTLPIDEIAERIESLDAVADARVTRDWPSSLTIVVRERRPVGYVELSDGGAGLVGSDGSIYRQERRPPKGLPQLPGIVNGNEGSMYADQVDDASRAAFEVAASLPPSLYRAVAQVDASSVQAIELTFRDGVVVEWGSANDSELKARVVDALRQRPGWGAAFTLVNVTAPDAPALSAE